MVGVVAPSPHPHGHGDPWLGPGLQVVEASAGLRPPSYRRHRPVRCPSRHRGRLGYYLSRTTHLITSPASRSQNGRRNRHELEHGLEEAPPLEGSRELLLCYFRVDWVICEWEFLEYPNGADLVDFPWRCLDCSWLDPRGKPGWNAGRISG